MTRDQYTGIVNMMLTNKDIPPVKKAAKGLLWKMIKRFGLTNSTTDIGEPKDSPKKGKAFPNWFGFTQFGNLFRACFGWLAYPIYLITDLELVVNAIKYRFFSDEVDIINNVLRVCVCSTYYPTP